MRLEDEITRELDRINKKLIKQKNQHYARFNLTTLLLEDYNHGRTVTLIARFDTEELLLEYLKSVTV